MPITRRSLLATASAGVAATSPRRARAQAKPVLRIGCLSDMSGPYKDLAGPVATACAKLAGMDFGVSGQAWDFEVVQADHQNKPDLGASLAREWFDRGGVDAIVEVSNSAVALAVASVARDKNKVCLNSGAATSDLTGARCNANTIHWTYDTYMLAKSTGGALVKAGGLSWYFITADYAFGRALQRDATDFVESAGGKVLGSVAYPFPGTTDFSALLVRAQDSGAQVLAFANAGADAINSVKQAREFGVNAKMTIAALLIFVSDVHAIGLPVAQGLVYTDSFYWDHSARTRAFSKRLQPFAPTVRPTMVQAGVYSSTLHYLKVASEVGPAAFKADGGAAVAAMKGVPVDDDCFGESEIRIDGRCIHPSFLWKVKTPEESQYPWDYCTLIGELPAAGAFRTIYMGGCSLVTL